MFDTGSDSSRIRPPFCGRPCPVYPPPELYVSNPCFAAVPLAAGRRGMTRVRRLCPLNHGGRRNRAWS